MTTRAPSKGSAEVTVARTLELPPGPLREAAKRRMWAIGNEIVDLYKSRRPAPLAASWVADSEKSTKD